MYYYIEKIIAAINYAIEKDLKNIDTKKIRRILNIDSLDKSMVNFIWRNLEYLEANGFLKLMNKKSPKKYRLPKKKLEIIEVH